MPIGQKHWIRQRAIELGFLSVGFAKAKKLDKEARQLEQWLSNDYHGKMAYMANHFDKRIDPRLLVPGAQSVISFLFNYHPTESIHNQGIPKISTYAYGRDYHKILKKKLKILFNELEAIHGNINGRIFVDSAPVLERQWAAKSGLGWLGKNSLLIHPKKGSRFFLAEIISDLSFEQDHPINDYCGTCTRCIDACPTEAISPEGYIVDASKCISYLTIELKDAIPEGFLGKTDDWVFGCDICQDVCPWDRFSKGHQEPAFNPHPELAALSRDDWKDLTESTFDKLFHGTPVKRTKFSGLKRNVAFWLRGKKKKTT